MLDVMGSEQAGVLPGQGSGDRALRAVPRSCRERGLDLSGVGPPSGQQKHGKDYESLFGEINDFHAPTPHHKNKTMLRRKNFERNTANH